MVFVMSPDLRNSIILWVGSIAFFGLGWLSLKFGVHLYIPDTWLWAIVGAVGFVNGVQFCVGLWKRRASKPKSPNQKQVRQD